MIALIVRCLWSLCHRITYPSDLGRRANCHGRLLSQKISLNHNARDTDEGHGGKRTGDLGMKKRNLLVGLWVTSTAIATTGWWAGLAFTAVWLMERAFS